MEGGEGEEPLSSSLQSPAVTPAAAPTATSAPSLRDTLLAVFGTKVAHVPASGHSASAHRSVLHTCGAPPPLRTLHTCWIFPQFTPLAYGDLALPPPPSGSLTNTSLRETLSGPVCSRQLPPPPSPSLLPSFHPSPPSSFQVVDTLLPVPPPSFLHTIPYHASLPPHPFRWWTHCSRWPLRFLSCQGSRSRGERGMCGIV